MNHRCYRGLPEVRGPFCETLAVQHNVRFQILKAASLVTELIEVRLEVVLPNLRVLTTLSMNGGSGLVLEIPFDMERSMARFSSSSRARGPERSFCPSRSAISVRNFLVDSTSSVVSPSAENVASRTAKNSSQLRSLNRVNERNETLGISAYPFSVIRR